MKPSDKWSALSHSSSFVRLASCIYFGVFCNWGLVLLYLPYFSERWKFSLRAEAWVPPISFIMFLCRSEASSRDPSGGAAVGGVETSRAETSPPAKRHDSDYERVVPNDEGNAAWRLLPPRHFPSRLSPRVRMRPVVSAHQLRGASPLACYPLQSCVWFHKFSFENFNMNQEQA